MSTTTRVPLSRDRVAGAALAFIDEHGLAALSMRKLGAELGVEAMSLYNHVANKDDLLDAVSEILYGDVLARLDRTLSAWQDELRDLARTFRRVATEHQNAIPIFLDRVTPSRVKYEFLARCFGIFTSAGFDTKEAAVAFDISASWALGAIRQELGLMADLERMGGGMVAREDLPEDYQPVVDFTEACLAWTPEQRFDYGLETVLAGLEVRLGS